MGKLPGFTFYPGDWLRDHVSGCSLAAQGLWLRMMILAHDSDRYGYLVMNGTAIPAESIARRCGCTLPQYVTLLAELDAAGVPSRTPEGIIFSRRMVKDDKSRKLTRLRVRKLRSCNADVTLMYEDENEKEVLRELDSKKPESKTKPKSVKSRGTRLPEDYIPQPEHYDLAKELGVNCEMEFQKFRDYFLGVHGSKGVKLDWNATLRNWLRNSLNFGGKHAAGRQSESILDRIASGLVEAHDEAVRGGI